MEKNIQLGEALLELGSAHYLDALKIKNSGGIPSYHMMRLNAISKRSTFLKIQ